MYEQRNQNAPRFSKTSAHSPLPSAGLDTNLGDIDFKRFSTVSTGTMPESVAGFKLGQTRSRS
jgi:hypothetical protein